MGVIKDSHHRTGVRLDFEPEVDFARATFWKYRSDFYHKLELVEARAHVRLPNSMSGQPFGSTGQTSTTKWSWWRARARLRLSNFMSGCMSMDLFVMRNEFLLQAEVRLRRLSMVLSILALLEVQVRLPLHPGEPALTHVLGWSHDRSRLLYMPESDFTA